MFDLMKLTDKSFLLVINLGERGTTPLLTITDLVRDAAESGVSRAAIRRKMAEHTADVLAGAAEPLGGEDAERLAALVAEVVELAVAD